MPEYPPVTKIRLKRGFSIDAQGAPEQTIHDAAPARSMAVVVGEELAGPPALCVEQGAPIRAGAVLFRDSQHPEIRFTAPVSGRVTAIHRGARRRLLSVELTREGDEAAPKFEAYARESLSSLAADAVRDRLLEAGLWTALRSRPFGCIPGPHEVPGAILVTAIDTNPLACDPAAVIAPRMADFVDGVRVLGVLAPRLFVCKSPSLELAADEITTAKVVEFSGPHPAGLPGTHVAHLARATGNRPVWHLGYQDVIAIGALFARGQLSSERVVALGGSGALRPRLLRTEVGASLDELLAGEVAGGARVILGSLLGGREADPATAYIGRYDTQLTLMDPPVVQDASRRGALSRWLGKLLGSSTAMLPLEKFERIWPLPQPVLPLLRALLVGDADRAVELGCLDLAEEDLALCSFACPGKLDYGAALRDTLRQLQERD